jgi:hypothetical protein
MLLRYLWLLLQVALYAIAAAIVLWVGREFDWRIVAMAPYTFVAAFYPFYAEDFGKVSAAAFLLTFLLYFVARKHGSFLAAFFLLHLANLGLLLFIIFVTSRG